MTAATFELKCARCDITFRAESDAATIHQLSELVTSWHESKHEPSGLFQSSVTVFDEPEGVPA